VHSNTVTTDILGTEIFWPWKRISLNHTDSHKTIWRTSYTPFIF